MGPAPGDWIVLSDVEYFRHARCAVGYAGGMYAIHELSQTVRTRRQEIGLSQQRLATLAGLSRATIVQLEGGTLKDLSFTRTAAALEVLGLGLTIGPLSKLITWKVPVASTTGLAQNSE